MRGLQNWGLDGSSGMEYVQRCRFDRTPHRLPSSKMPAPRATNGGERAVSLCDRTTRSDLSACHFLWLACRLLAAEVHSRPAGSNKCVFNGRPSVIDKAVGLQIVSAPHVDVDLPGAGWGPAGLPIRLMGFLAAWRRNFVRKPLWRWWVNAFADVYCTAIRRNSLRGSRR